MTVNSPSSPNENHIEILARTSTGQRRQNFVLRPRSGHGIDASASTDRSCRADLVEVNEVSRAGYVTAEAVPLEPKRLEERHEDERLTGFAIRSTSPTSTA